MITILNPECSFVYNNNKTFPLFFPPYCIMNSIILSTKNRNVNVPKRSNQ